MYGLCRLGLASFVLIWYNYIAGTDCTENRSSAYLIQLLALVRSKTQDLSILTLITIC